MSKKGDKAYKKQQYNKAYKYYNKARDLSLQYYKKKSEYTAKSYIKLAAVCNKRDRYEEAIEHYKKAMKILCKKNSDHPNLLTIYSELGALYAQTENYEEAIEHYTKAMEILCKKSPDHLDLLTIYSQLGALYKQTKNYTEAVTYLKKALEQDRNKNATSKEIAQKHDTIAWLYRRIKSKKQAIKHYEKAFAIYTSIEKKDSLLVAKSYHNLSCVYIDDNQNKKAIEHAEKALNIYKEKKKSIAQASCYHNLGIATRQLITSEKKGNYEGAIRYQKNELAIYLFKEKQASSIEIAICCYQLGLSLQADGQYKKAIKYHKKVSDIYSKPKIKASDSAKALNWYHLGLSYYYDKQYKEAIKSYVKALRIRRKIEKQTPTQKNSNRIADICRSLGDVHCTREEYMQAKKCYQQSLTIRSTKKYPPLDIAKSHENLGLACYYNNEEKEAIKHHQKAIELRELNNGELSDIAQGYRNLGLAFYHDEQYQEAIDNYRKASNMYKSIPVQDIEKADINRYLGDAYLQRAISFSETSDQEMMNDAYKNAKICYKEAISIYENKEPEKLDECKKKLALVPNTTMFEATIQREHKKALKLGIMQGKEEGLREGELRGKQAIGSLLEQGAISQEQAKQALKGFLYE